MVELYLSSEVSYQELASSQGINNASFITCWVNEFKVAGSDTLRLKKKGRKKTLNSKNISKALSSIKNKTTDTNAEQKKAIENILDITTKKEL